MNTDQRPRRLGSVDFPAMEKTMSDHATTTLQGIGLGSAVLASLVFAPGTATAAANNPIVIDFDQGRLILGWASLWIVTIIALLACDAGGRAITRYAAHALARRIRHTLQFWRITSRLDRAARRPGAAKEVRPQATAGRICAAQMAAVLAESRVRRRERDVQMVYPAAHRQASGRTFRSTPVPGLPTHHRTVPA